MFAQFADSLEVDVDGTLNRFVGFEVLGSEAARQQLRKLSEVISQEPKPRLQALRAGLGLLQNLDLSAGLDCVLCPSLLIAGSHDQLIAPAAMQETANRLSDASIEVIQGSGHAPFIGHRPEFVGLVSAFCRTECGAAA